MTPITQRRVRSLLDPLVRAMLFVGAAKFTAPVQGNPQFVRSFEARVPRDPQGRSLRDLDLKTRLFKYLARVPDQIPIGAVVRDMEEQLGVLGCLQGAPGYCRIEGGCVLRGALRQATEAFLTTLDAYTLADLVKPRHALVRLMGLGTAVTSL